jgi:putative acetyltransferase
MNPNAINVRGERPDDIEAIRALNLAAFGGPREGALVDALRANGGISLSLVATVGGKVAGHILYSPVTISCNGKELAGAGLGPMAVLPGHQRKGIGTELIRAGNEELKIRGYPFIVVLGHPEYYPRFGFRPAGARGIHCRWGVPDNLFMILFLDESAMKGVSGLAKYRPEFSELL